MAPADRHADNVALAEPSKVAATPAAAAKVAKPIDNAAQAAVAERERTFTVGGDAPEPGAVVPVSSQLQRALDRVRSADRPTPFGTQLFPPLPPPPRMR